MSGGADKNYGFMNFAVAIDSEKCNNCFDRETSKRHKCVKECSEKHLLLHWGVVCINKAVKCNGCGKCVEVCKQEAITVINLSLI